MSQLWTIVFLKKIYNEALTVNFILLPLFSFKKQKGKLY